jgi:sterol desaturase/sphingolipid hydroxylase (fatty acid hydroxylase superfamily)
MRDLAKQYTLSLLTQFFFFYLIGTNIRQQYDYITSFVYHSEFLTFSILTVVIHFTTRLISFLIYEILYCFPILDKYKTSSGDWPWIKNKEEYSNLRKRNLVNLFVEFFYSFILSSMLYFPIKYFNLIYFDILPKDGIELYIDILVLTLSYDFCFYFLHRLMHSQWLYKKYHKIHHEYRDNISWAQEHNSIGDVIIQNVIPLYITLSLWPVHVYTFWIFSITTFF